MEGSIKWN